MFTGDMGLVQPSCLGTSGVKPPDMDDSATTHCVLSFAWACSSAGVKKSSEGVSIS